MVKHHFHHRDPNFTTDKSKSFHMKIIQFSYSFMCCLFIYLSIYFINFNVFFFHIIGLEAWRQYFGRFKKQMADISLLSGAGRPYGSRPGSSSKSGYIAKSNLIIQVITN